AFRRAVAAVEYQGARCADLRRLRLPVRDRRGGAAGGDRRGDRAYMAAPQGDALPEPVRAGEGASARPAADRQHGLGEARRLTRPQGEAAARGGPVQRWPTTTNTPTRCPFRRHRRWRIT